MVAALVLADADSHTVLKREYMSAAAENKQRQNQSLKFFKEK
jgi:hypothetical protein